VTQPTAPSAAIRWARGDRSATPCWQLARTQDLSIHASYSEGNSSPTPSPGALARAGGTALGPLPLQARGTRGGEKGESQHKSTWHQGLPSRVDVGQQSRTQGSRAERRAGQGRLSAAALSCAVPYCAVLRCAAMLWLPRCAMLRSACGRTCMKSKSLRVAQSTFQRQPSTRRPSSFSQARSASRELRLGAKSREGKAERCGREQRVVRDVQA